MSTEKKRYLRLETAAEVYDIKERTLRDMCIKKELESVKVKGRWHILATALQKLFGEVPNAGRSARSRV